MKRTDPRTERELQRREDFKQSIIHAAEAVILRRGIPATTMDDVARAARLSKATLYRYFKSKGDLLFEIIVHYYDEVQQKLQAVLDGPGRRAVDKLKDSIRAVLAYQEENENIARVIIMDPSVLKLMRVFVDEEARARSAAGRRFLQMMKTRRQDVLDTGTQLIALGIESGEYRDLDVPSAVLFLEAVLQGYIHGRILFEKTGSIDELAEMIAGFVLRGIQRTPETSKGASR
ncbi:MAG: TetR/AcrR family transcriptional regulator [Candidatus Aminicenantes bacterium]|nr:TetR/AcrR family transcriptional regulator [Candidatus Aminicenantes bacterium]